MYCFSRASEWAYWKEFLSQPLPWDINAVNFKSKCSIMGLLRLLPPVSPLVDLSPWRDPHYGPVAMRIEQLCLFDVPIRGPDLPQGCVTRLKSMKNSLGICTALMDRIRHGDYMWHWKCLDENSFPVVAV